MEQLLIVKTGNHPNVQKRVVHALDLKLHLVAVVVIHIQHTYVHSIEPKPKILLSSLTHRPFSYVTLHSLCIGKPLKKEEQLGYCLMKIK